MTAAEFQMRYPYVLLLLILIIPLFLFELKKRKLLVVDFSSIHRLGELNSSSLRQVFQWIPILLKVLAFSFLVFALAEPHESETLTETDSEGIDIVLALDTSESMYAHDFKVNGERVDRLTVIKNVVKDFVKERPFDRIGLVVFGDQAFTQCPLTLDHDVLVNYLDLIQIGMVGRSTAIGNSIATAIKRLKNSKAESKIIVLLTDGENTAGEITPIKASEVAKELGIKIYTIGVGKDGEVPIPRQTFFGKRFVNVLMPLDEKTLKDISKLTDGLYFRAENTEGLKEIYSKIDELEKTKVTVNQYKETTEHFQSFALLSLICFLLSYLLERTVFKRIPV